LHALADTLARAALDSAQTVFVARSDTSLSAVGPSSGGGLAAVAQWLWEVFKDVIVPMFVGFGAAYFGAKKAGEVTLQAQREAAAALHLQRVQARIEGQLARQQAYQRRLRADLWQALMLNGRLREGHGHAPISDVSAAGMLSVWRGYLRHRDDILEFEKPLDRVRIVECFEKCRVMALAARAFEAKIRSDREKIGPGLVEPVTLREALLKEMASHGNTIKQILEEKGWGNVASD
jgi:hypothetical protein